MVSYGSALTQAQLGIWLGCCRENDSSSYVTSECVILAGQLNRAAFERAVEATLAEATALHARFEEKAGIPRRVPQPGRTIRLEHASLEAQADPEAELLRLAKRELRRPFDLESGDLVRHRLVRLSADRHAWLQFAHHIALDAYGFQLLQRRVAERYDAETRERPLAASPFTPFEPVLEEDTSYESSPRHDEDRAYWLEAIGARRAAGPRAVAAFGPGVRAGHVWPRERLTLLEQEAARARSSWAEVLLAIVAARVGARYAASGFVLGLPVMLRLGTRALRTPCTTMNIVPLPIDLDGASSVASLAQAIRRTLQQQRSHQRYRYEQLRTEVNGRLFGPVVNILPLDTPLRFGECRARIVRIAAGPVEHLAVSFAPAEDGLLFDVDRNPELVGASEAAELGAEIESDVRAWLDEPGRPLPSPPRRVWSTPAGAEAAPRGPIEALRAHAAVRPDAIALVEGARAWSYAALERAARACARRWLAEGCASGDRVAVHGPRGALTIVAILGVLYAGAGYVALDPAHPLERRRRAVEATTPSLVVHAAVGELEPALGAHARVVRVDTAELERWGDDAADAPLPSGDPTRLAYAVFTSGSTGEPKAVAVSYGALSHFVQAARAVYGVEPHDRVLQFAPLTFDASVEEIFVTLAAGATLVVRDEASLESSSVFLAEVARAAISVLDLPTAFWHELAFAVAERGLKLPPSVRTVIIGGEAASPAWVRAWCSAAPSVRLLNTYGPSETTVVVLTAELDARTPDAVPIGRPLPGVVVAIVNERGGVEPGPGAVGELCVAGPTLATGYLGRDDLTRQRFSEVPGLGRAYRTGDRVERLADGQLAFRGRVDDEIKISGYRVAPREVEATLELHGRVRAAIAWGEDGAGGALLVAHVEASGIRAPELRRFVAGKLPAPMVPTVLEVHERLPRDTNGKIDRAALGRRAALPAEPATTAPSSLEAAIVAIWRDVLGVARVELDDDFFALGGHSLKAIQLANRLSALGSEVRVAGVFRNPTPRKQARLVGDSVAGPDAFVPRAVSLPEDAFPVVSVGRPDAASRLLISGATGFVGAHLLREWLSERGREAVCLVRARTEAEARAALLERARASGVELGSVADRIAVAPADLSEPSAWGRALARELAPAGAVVHAAAHVSVTRDYESLAPVNVLATRELLGLAARWGSAFHFVSTIATLPLEGEGGGALLEAFYPAHPGLNDGYRRSKWHAEALCEQAGAMGLPVAVHRLGRVTGPRARPSVRRTDLVWRIARAATRAGVWPALAVEEPWIPVDDAARAMVRLVLGGAATAPASAYHVTHTGLVQLDGVRAVLVNAGYVLDVAPLDAWVARVRATADDEDLATLAFFELQRHGDDAPRVAASRAIACEALLARTGGDIAPVGADLLRAYCRAAVASGVLGRPPNDPPVQRAGDPQDSRTAAH